MNGNSVGSNTVTINPSANPNLLAYGSSWKWFFAEGGPAADWNSATFDDSTWAAGLGELGYGDSDGYGDGNADATRRSTPSRADQRIPGRSESGRRQRRRVVRVGQRRMSNHCG